jgi:penicillin-binding protein 2
MHSMAFLEAGVQPDEAVNCPGGLRVGNRFFRCWKRGGHGRVDMAKGIYQSCDTYFYHFAQQVGFDKVADMAKRMGLGQEFDLPVTSQFYGTVPSPEWKQSKYDQPWAAFDTVNASIGQGYYLTNPLQLAVMAARLATGSDIKPRLVMANPQKKRSILAFPNEQLNYVRKAMSDVVNGPGTAGRARLPIDGIEMAGKTGTAQVVSLNISDGKSGPWKYRDHGLFIFFAPADKPKYAGAVVIEHGGGSGSAYPIARDVMTFLFDPIKGMDALYAFEKQWGGTPKERMARKYEAFASQSGVDVPRPPVDLNPVTEKVDAEARARAFAAQTPDVVEDPDEAARRAPDGAQ